MNVILPEVNFLNTDADALSRDLIELYEEFEGRTLSQADPLNLIFLAVASVIVKQNIKLNDSARQNLLWYARGPLLDHRGAEINTPRLLESPATVTMRFHLSEPLTSSRIIDSGTMVTSSEAAIFFESVEDVVIPVGVTHLDIDFTATTAGKAGNGFVLGRINTLVNPIPYVSKVENITVSDGGSDKETDDEYRERIYMAPESFTNAGSEGAYEYFAKKASSLIGDVYVYMPIPGHVNIMVLMKNGELPTQEIIDAVFESCSDKKVRPLTDRLNVSAPEVVEFDVDVTYYIDTNLVNINTAQENITAAVEDYIVWQSSKIGRDINQSRLINAMYQAGAKRIEVINPSFTRLEKNQVAKLNTKQIVFGGVEND